MLRVQPAIGCLIKMYVNFHRANQNVQCRRVGCRWKEECVAFQGHVDAEPPEMRLCAI